MPINVYCGVMGSGKTYEVTKNVIVPAIRKGRNVVSNISGLNETAIHEYIVHKWGDPLEKLGSIRLCEDSDIIEVTETTRVLKASFLPWNASDGDKKSFVKAGDLVVIDEAQRYWDTTAKLPKAHLLFFTEHRHFAHPETKVTCDLVLMLPSMALLHRALKSIAELSFCCTKLKAVGAPKSYRIEMWEGTKQTRKDRQRVEVRPYDKDVYPLYQSYEGGAGKEHVVDKRQQITSPAKIAAFAVLLLLCFGGTSFWLYRLLHRHSAQPASVAAATATAAPAAGSFQVASRVTGAGGVELAVPRVPPVVLSPDWRLAGFVQVGTERRVVLANAAGRLRYETPAAFTWEDGQPVFGMIDGQRVTAYSGALPGASQGGGAFGLFGASPTPVPPPQPAAPVVQAAAVRQ